MRWIAALAAVAVAALLGAGCGKDETTGAATTGETPATTAALPPTTPPEDLSGEVEILQGSTPVVVPGLAELEGIEGQAELPAGEEGAEVEDSAGLFRPRAPEPPPSRDPVLDLGPAESQQFAFPFDEAGDATGPSYSCVAVSRTSDPLGEWCVAAYAYSDVDWYDYPKLGVWGNAYLLTADTPLTTQVVSQLVVIERDPYHDDGGLPGSQGGDSLLVLELTPDFEAGTAVADVREVPVAAFDSSLCGYATDCLPVPGPGETLDAMSFFLMGRAAFRRFEGYDAVALTHTVDVDGNDRAGIRWYELRHSGGEWQVAGEGTFAPDDGNSRWLGAAALDAAGSLAVAYVVAGPETLPSVRYTGRLAGDPPGKLTLGEATLVEGGGVQTDGYHRWGDYAALSLDPLDDCAFWYTGEYYPETSEVGWATRVVAFRLPGCQAATP